MAVGCAPLHIGGLVHATDEESEPDGLHQAVEDADAAADAVVGVVEGEQWGR
jgi:hypothetical protein